MIRARPIWRIRWSIIAGRWSTVLVYQIACDKVCVGAWRVEMILPRGASGINSPARVDQRAAGLFEIIVAEARALGSTQRVLAGPHGSPLGSRAQHVRDL